MITYNHEKFIAQAIDSILMQEVNFDYEIVIGEDCSTDNTRNILIDLKKRYPDKIRLLLPEKNLGMINNFVSTLQACQGKYVALLEGDDYWTSTSKLQKQVDLLEKNFECSISFHDATEVYISENGHQEFHSPVSNYQKKDVFELEDLLAGNFNRYTCTCLFRRELVQELPNWFYKSYAADYPIFVLNAQHGRIIYLHEDMAVYRIHRGGVWSSKSKIQQLQGMIELLKTIDKHLKYQFTKTIKSRLSKFYYSLSIEYSSHGKLLKSIKAATQCFLEFPFNQEISYKDNFKKIIKLFIKKFVYKPKNTPGI